MLLHSYGISSLSRNTSELFSQLCCITTKLFAPSSFLFHHTPSWGSLLALNWYQWPSVDILHSNLINITEPLISYQPWWCIMLFVRIKEADTRKCLCNLQNMVLIHLPPNHIPSVSPWVTCLAFIFPEDLMSRVIHCICFGAFAIYWAYAWMFCLLS